jgi:hypothetical protein
LPIAIVSFSIVALCLMSAPLFGQHPDGPPPATSPHQAPAWGHVMAPPGMPVPPPCCPPNAPGGKGMFPFNQFENLKEKLSRLAEDLTLKLLSNNQAHLLSGNSPKFLSENEPEILSGNKTQLLSGNHASIFSGNHVSFFSGLKIEIHIENTGNNNGNQHVAPSEPPEKDAKAPE